MFLIFSGKPGGGKTYRVVNEILKPENQEKYVILHNIDGLKPANFSHPELVIDWREKYIKSGLVASVDEFFSESFQTELSKNFHEKYQKPMLIVIDECHRWFQNKNDIILAWLSFHRHLGQYVIGITQRETMIHHTYRALHQYELRAKLDLFLCFAYAKIENGENCGYSFIRKKKAVFDSYLSYTVESKSYSNKLFFAIIPLLLLVGWYFFQNPFQSNVDVSPGNPVVVSGVSVPSGKSVVSPGAVSVVVPSLRCDSILKINSNYVFSGMVSFWVGDKLDFSRSKIFLTDKNGICFECRDIFPRMKFLYITSSSVAFVDSDKKTPVIFLKSFQPEEAAPGSLGGGVASSG